MVNQILCQRMFLGKEIQFPFHQSCSHTNAMTKLLEIITAIILLLGYVAYGLSIYCYTYAQRTIGAAKTSTYYALAPFIGALLSILMLGEPVTSVFIIASIIMAAGCWIAAK